MAEPQYIQAYSFGDFFDRMFRMLKHTWKTSVFGGLILSIVPAVLVGVAFRSVFSQLFTLVEYEASSSYLDWGPIWRVLGAYGMLFLALLFSGALAKLGSLAVAHRTRDAALGRESTWFGCLGEAFSLSLGRTIVQSLLKGLIVIGIMVVPTVIVAVASAVGGGGAAPLFIGMAIVYLGVSVAAIWILFSLLFSDYAVVFDRARIIEGLRTSGRLVRGNWWRLFGISLLLGIALSFALGLITTPIAGAGMLPFMGRIMELSIEGTFDEIEIFQLFADARGIVIAFALTMVIQQVGTLLFVPVFRSLFYIDLKVRAGEMGDAGERPETATDPTPPEADEGTETPPEQL